MGALRLPGGASRCGRVAVARRPVEGPLEQELSSCPGEAGPVLVRLEHLSDHILQPSCPLLQRALLL